MDKKIGHLYRTTCVSCGESDAHVKYFLWVKVIECRKCQGDIDLFPGYLLAGNSRHPKNVFVCSTCNQLTETDDRKSPGSCTHCQEKLIAIGPAKRNRCHCSKCGIQNSYPNPTLGPPRHRLFAIEYYCPSCRRNHVGRYFKVPDSRDIAHVKEVEREKIKIFNGDLLLKVTYSNGKVVSMVTIWNSADR